jgi:acylphosphatase
MGDDAGTDVVRLRLRITGRVQGVFFRASCRRVALSNGLAGSARNLPDGTVEVVLEGPQRAVEQGVAWCREGPSGALVRGVTIIEEPPGGESGFRVG